jgi:hypothetical protein
LNDEQLIEQLNVEALRLAIAATHGTLEDPNVTIGRAEMFRKWLIDK